MAARSVDVGWQLRTVLQKLNDKHVTDDLVESLGGPKPATMSNLRTKVPWAVHPMTLRNLDTAMPWEPGTAERLAGNDADTYRRVVDGLDVLVSAIRNASPTTDRGRGEGWMPGQKDRVLAALEKMQNSHQAASDALAEAIAILREPDAQP